MLKYLGNKKIPYAQTASAERALPGRALYQTAFTAADVHKLVPLARKRRENHGSELFAFVKFLGTDGTMGPSACFS
jgi:hypothetical protein